jgi:Predicted permease
MTKYPTQWQRQTMWAALTAVFIVLLIAIVCSVIWTVANVVRFIQPILIPVAIAVILAYLLDPLVTKMSERGLGRTKSVLALFAITFLIIGVLVAWLAPVVSMQATNVGRELPQYTQKARDSIVDLIFKYDHAFGGPSTKRDKVSSPTSSLLNWLFASPSPAQKKTPAPAPNLSPEVVTPPEIAPSDSAPPAPREEIASTSDKISTADRQRIQAWVQRQLPNLERQLPYISEKIWTLLKQSIGGFLG